MKNKSWIFTIIIVLFLIASGAVVYRLAGMDKAQRAANQIALNEGSSIDGDIDYTIDEMTPQHQAFMEKEVPKLVDGITNDKMTDLQKENAIHDWILDNVDYDKTLQYTDAYAALTEGKTVCVGYAVLNSLMLEAAGIESKIVTGENLHDSNTEKHAWNLVEIDGQWYHSDLTWCDGSDDKYQYYNKTDNFMSTNGYYWTTSNYPASAKKSLRYDKDTKHSFADLIDSLMKD